MRKKVEALATYNFFESNMKMQTPEESQKNCYLLLNQHSFLNTLIHLLV